ncbi:hypothetical protein [Paludisphaera sp.]|uniref:hypothetical protein n=1 Tax=Paludisphaera sp. TaxID=2017432 RepID=UPI00301CC567
MHPTMPASLQPLVGVSGFDIDELRVTYTPDNGGTLSVGINQPTNPFDPLGRDVIASDADNNGNWGTVNPLISNTSVSPPTGLFPAFQDPADFGGSEYMGVYVDFIGANTGQIVAGFSQAVPSGQAPKTFQVAEAIQAAPNVIPTFGTQLPQFQGNIYTQNDPNHPNMELSIINFDTLYESITGSPLTANSVIKVGAFGGSGVDLPITEALFPLQPVLIGAATPQPEVCPPISPPIHINPHEHRIIDTAHDGLVRVYVQGTSGFDPSTIDPATVDLNGAKPVATKPYQFPRNPYGAQVFVFKASDIQAEPGLQTLTFTGATYDGQTIITQNQVVNVPNSAQVGGRLKFLMNRGNESQYNSLRRLASSNPEAILDWSIFDRQAAAPMAAPVALAVPAQAGGALGTATPASVSIPGAPLAASSGLKVDYSSATRLGTPTPIVAPRAVVSVPSEQGGPRLSGRLGRGLEDYLDGVAADRANSAAAADQDEVMSGAH